MSVRRGRRVSSVPLRRQDTRAPEETEEVVGNTGDRMSEDFAEFLRNGSWKREQGEAEEIEEPVEEESESVVEEEEVEPVVEESEEDQLPEEEDTNLQERTPAFNRARNAGRTVGNIAGGIGNGAKWLWNLPKPAKIALAVIVGIGILLIAGSIVIPKIGERISTQEEETFQSTTTPAKVATATMQAGNVKVQSQTSNGTSKPETVTFFTFAEKIPEGIGKIWGMLDSKYQLILLMLLGYVFLQNMYNWRKQTDLTQAFLCIIAVISWGLLFSGLIPLQYNFPIFIAAIATTINIRRTKGKFQALIATIITIAIVGVYFAIPTVMINVMGKEQLYRDLVAWISKDTTVLTLEVIGAIAIAVMVIVYEALDGKIMAGVTGMAYILAIHNFALFGQIKSTPILEWILLILFFLIIVSNFGPDEEAVGAKQVARNINDPQTASALALAGLFELICYLGTKLEFKTIGPFSLESIVTNNLIVGLIFGLILPLFTTLFPGMEQQIEGTLNWAQRWTPMYIFGIRLVVFLDLPILTLAMLLLLMKLNFV